MDTQESRFKLSCDIGGTFTDFFLVDQRTGEVDSEKCLTTPSDPAQGVLNGIDLLAKRHPNLLAKTDSVLHATTLVINALIERKGARTALITTEGFKDVLEIGREMRYDLYDIFITYPKPLVPRQMRLELRERMNAHGDIICKLDVGQAEGLVTALEREGVESLAVCLLHSYVNPAHEQQLRSFIEARLPRLPVSLSSEVLPEIKEYERTSTTVANAYVKPLVERYIDRLVSRLRDQGFSKKLLIMLSSGGMASTETVSSYPVRIVESGPAAGALAASHVAAVAGFSENVLAFDMGGTTAKGCVIRNGQIDMAMSFEAARVHRFKKGSGIPLRLPVIDIMEIGAGGGSIAAINELGLLQVGPESAAADPGPACYGLGGVKPTVTDANVVLGYLNPAFFLGGAMKLDADAARKALAIEVADPLGVSIDQAAWRVHDLVTENMASAIRVHMTEKGVDPERFTLVAFGGGGPVHGYTLARRLGVRRLLVPPSAGIASALGLLVSPVSFDVVRTVRIPLSDQDLEARLLASLGEMQDDGKRSVKSVEPAADVLYKRFAEVSYIGQGFSVSVELPNEPEITGADIRVRFESSYANLYGQTYDEMPAQIVSLRTVAFCPAADFRMAGPPKKLRPDLAVKSKRSVFSAEKRRFCEFPVYDRYALAPGISVTGPALIEEKESTVVIDFGGRGTVDQHGIVAITIESETIA
ncbi:hydantoinase/oxoprolinase family protein [Hydrogenophaga sp. BPS33]|uniref:hydantoinase/oxoprolinase family protein n=1 Tax=Hydrogenophaga sp. BPS33 TaxID=2651974 RepID=UPI00135BDEB3|nr:hydantoinase/oxoprolinase family protein [Hydrogenophaga sp. BPS33]